MGLWAYGFEKTTIYLFINCLILQGLCVFGKISGKMFFMGGAAPSEKKLIVEEKIQTCFPGCHARQIFGAFPWQGCDTANGDKIIFWSNAISVNK